MVVVMGCCGGLGQNVRDLLIESSHGEPDSGSRYEAVRLNFWCDE